MPLARTRVDVRNDFAEVTAAIAQGAREGVEVGARVGAQVASAVAAERSKSGTMANVQAGNATRTVDGWVASFVSRAYYAGFQNWGTLGKRRKALKQAPRTNRTRAPGTGITPLGFVQAGRGAGRRAMLARIRRSLP